MIAIKNFVPSPAKGADFLVSSDEIGYSQIFIETLLTE